MNGRTHVTIGDTTARLAHWCEAFDVSVRVALYRIGKGWPVWEAVCQPARRTGAEGELRETRARAWRDGVPYEHDLRCQRFVAEHPHGATLEEVGAELGVTRERVRQIEAAAIRRLRKAAQRLAPDLEEAIAQLLAERGEVMW